MPEILFTVGGKRVVQTTPGEIAWISGLTIDADGSPHAYHPRGCPPGLDDLANAGRPGNWWALALLPDGTPVVQGPGDLAPGFYVSTTSYECPGFAATDPRRYVDSETVPFIVVPAPWRAHLLGVILGCKAVVENLENGRSTEAVVADFGPATHLGEGSIALARLLGIPSDPRRGGCEDNVQFKIYPSVVAAGFELQPLRA